MCRGLIALGHRVTVVCGFGERPRESCEDNVRTLRLLDMRSSTSSSLPEQTCAILERLIARESVDVIEFPARDLVDFDHARHFSQRELPCTLH
jgi:hypothetical protein